MSEEGQRVFRDLMNAMSVGTRSSIDSELAACAAEAVSYALNSGTHTFADFVHETADDLGDELVTRAAPYIELAWEIVRKKTGDKLGPGGRVAGVLEASRGRGAEFVPDLNLTWYDKGTVRAVRRIARGINRLRQTLARGERFPPRSYAVPRSRVWDDDTLRLFSQIERAIHAVRAALEQGTALPPGACAIELDPGGWDEDIIRFVKQVETALRDLSKGAKSCRRSRSHPDRFDSAGGDNDDETDWKGRAIAYKNARRYEDAATAFRKAVQESPADADAWFQLGVCSGELKRHEEAVEAFRQGLKFRDKDSWVWNNLGWNYECLRRAEDAIGAYQHAVTASAQDLYAWERLAGLWGSPENASRRLLALRRVAEIKQDFAAWDCLGRAYMEAGNPAQAVTAFQRALSCDSPLAGFAYVNLADAYKGLGFLLKAAQAYHKAVRIDPGNESARANLETLRAELNRTTARVRGFQRKRKRLDPPYSGYLNPFEVFRLDASHAASLEESTIARARKQLQHEMALNDGRVSWLEDAILDASQLMHVVDEARDPETREVHARIFQDRLLLRFLSHGDVSYFTPYAQSLQKERAVLPNPRLPDSVGRHFSRQYGRALLEAVELRGGRTIRAMYEGLPTFAAGLTEECYRPVYGFLRHTAEELESHEVVSEERARSLLALVEERVHPDTLNMLPSYFEDVRASIALAIREKAVECFNLHQQLGLSTKLLDLARALRVPRSVEEQFRQDSQKLDEIKETFEEIKRSKQPDAIEVPVGVLSRLAVRIGDDRIDVDDRSVAVEEISDLRWGATKVYSDGVCVEAYYQLSLAGDGWPAPIEIKFGSQSIIARLVSDIASMVKRQVMPDLAEVYDQLRDAVLRRVVPHVVRRWVAHLDRGGSAVIGECKIDRFGVRYEAGILFWKKQRRIPWDRLDLDFGGGYVILRDRMNQSCSVALNMRETWNAVLIPFIHSILTQRAES